ncbi:hypothetical protein [Rodentibacter pneumotropicus]|uniref:Uncharacterized protein n=1 Tax=Rodentibacter pneumotropicus TaxID=758 RepID=A0A4S2PHC8_9PAST|nr:hypothetical protein [Rodentibacter pneumotropicus]TGZ98739.1 hypothetical protein D3M79_08345 [Rodentibacter pneumotropicus]THA02772.1 hypothetical protein D3M74_02380 [Rodentibacter pneumotropicus]THA09903.1 hypothetical protein D3M77_01290 [Rodentibacter pneumotropicus]THA15391.1 hypothetical protein D3M76_05250 [Rodentibacter pneumotropicus]
MYDFLLKMFDLGIKLILAIIALFVFYLFGNALINGIFGAWYLVGGIIFVVFITTVLVPFLIRKFAPKDKQQAILDWYFWRN